MDRAEGGAGRGGRQGGDKGGRPCGPAPGGEARQSGLPSVGRSRSVRRPAWSDATARQEEETRRRQQRRILPGEEGTPVGKTRAPWRGWGGSERYRRGRGLRQGGPPPGAV